MAKGWLKALTTYPALVGDVTIVGLVDLDRATAEARAAEFGLTDAVIGTDLDTVLSETGADILFDIVVPAARRSVVARSRSTRPTIVTSATRAGLVVSACSQPLAMAPHPHMTAL